MASLEQLAAAVSKGKKGKNPKTVRVSNLDRLAAAVGAPAAPSNPALVAAFRNYGGPPAPAAPRVTTEGGSFLGKFAKNWAGNLLDTVTGAPQTIALLGKAAAAGPAAAYGLLPDSLPGNQAAERFAAGTGRDLKKAGEAIKDDYVQRYGPLFRGDLDEFGRQIYKNPLFFQLDALSVATGGAGGASRVAATGAKVGRRIQARRIRTTAPRGVPRGAETMSTLGRAISRAGEKRAQQPPRGPMRSGPDAPVASTPSVPATAAAAARSPLGRPVKSPTIRALKSGVKLAGDVAGLPLRSVVQAGRDLTMGAGARGVASTFGANVARELSGIGQVAATARREFPAKGEPQAFTMPDDVIPDAPPPTPSLPDAPAVRQPVKKQSKRRKPRPPEDLIEDASARLGRVDPEPDVKQYSEPIRRDVDSAYPDRRFRPQDESSPFPDPEPVERRWDEVDADPRNLRVKDPDTGDAIPFSDLVARAERAHRQKKRSPLSKAEVRAFRDIEGRLTRGESLAAKRAEVPQPLARRGGGDRGPVAESRGGLVRRGRDGGQVAEFLTPAYRAARKTVDRLERRRKLSPADRDKLRDAESTMREIEGLVAKDRLSPADRDRVGTLGQFGRGDGEVIGSKPRSEDPGRSTTMRPYTWDVEMPGGRTVKVTRMERFNTETGEFELSSPPSPDTVSVDRGGRGRTTSRAVGGNPTFNNRVVEYMKLDDGTYDVWDPDRKRYVRRRSKPDATDTLSEDLRAQRERRDRQERERLRREVEESRKAAVRAEKRIGKLESQNEKLGKQVAELSRQVSEPRVREPGVRGGNEFWGRVRAPQPGGPPRPPSRPPTAGGAFPFDEFFNEAGAQGPGRLERMLTSDRVTRMADARKVENRRRYWELSTLTAQVVMPNGQKVNLASAISRVERSRLSRNPFNASVQKGITRVMDGLYSALDARGLSWFGREARDARYLSRFVRQMNYEASMRRGAQVRDALRDYDRKVLYNRKFTKNPAAERALAMIVTGIAVHHGGESAFDRLQRAIAKQEAEIQGRIAGGRSEREFRDALKEVEGLKQIPRELVDEPPAWMTEAVDAARRLSEVNQSIRVDIAGRYGIDGNTYLRANQMREALLLGDAEHFSWAWDSAKPGVLVEGIASRARLQEFIGRYGVTHLTGSEAHEALLLMRRGERIPVSQQMILQRLVDQGYATADRLSVATSSELTSILNRYYSDLSKGTGYLPLDAFGRVKGDLARQSLGDGEAWNRLWEPEMLWAPGTSYSGTGRYIPALEHGFVRGERIRERANRGLGETGGVLKRSTGEYVLTAKASSSREALVTAINRSVTQMVSMETVQAFVDQFALKAKGSDKPVVIRKGDAYNQLEGLGDMWTAVPQRALHDAMQDAHRAETGASAKGDHFTEWIDNPELAAKLASEGQFDATVVLPTPLVREISKAAKQPSRLMEWYDNALNLWRAGVLAFTPRWFVNNMLGTSVFLGVMSGLDIQAIRLSKRESRVSLEAVPYEAESVTQAAEAGAVRGRKGIESQSGAYMRAAHRMYRLNERLESRLRRAAYISRAKSTMRNEGKLARRRRLSDDEVFEALTSMSQSEVRSTLDDINFFVGQYNRMSDFERTVMRRIIPFYSWLRVINTWVFAMPFRSPLRAEAMALAGTIGQELQGDRSHLPLWERGRIELGPLALRTNNINPAFSIAEQLDALGNPRGQVLTDLIRVFGGATTPPLQVGISQIAGRNPFGTRDFTAPLGDSFASFGRDRMYRNPVSGEIQTDRPSPSLLGQTVDSLLPFGQSARAMLSGKDRAYDTASLIDVIQARLGVKPEEQVFQPPKTRNTGREQLPFGLGTLSGLAGAPLYQIDKDAEAVAAERQELDFFKAYMDSLVARRKEAVRRGKDPLTIE